MNTKETSEKPGLRAFRSGSERTSTAPTEGSKTQRRKAALRSYNLTERKGGRTQGISTGT